MKFKKITRGVLASAEVCIGETAPQHESPCKIYGGGVYARVGARVRVKKINPQQNGLSFLGKLSFCREKW